MSLSDYFNTGREQEKKLQQRKQQRMPQRRNIKPKWYEPASIVIGAGVLYQLALPVLNVTLIPIIKGWKFIIRDIIAVIRSDVKIVSKKVTKKIDPNWEAYKRFEDLAEGKR